MKAKWKKIGLAMIAILLMAGLLFFLQNGNKNFKSGNTIGIQTDEELERYILNISSYKAQMTVSIQSNKTINKYKMTQEFEKNGTQRMIIEEPENRKGIEIEQADGKITVKNTHLGLSNLYEKEEEITGNRLWLTTFIETYKQDEGRNMSSTEDEIIMHANIQSKNPYYQYTELHIDSKTKRPTKLIVQDKDKNNRIYILYNEIEIYS